MINHGENVRPYIKTFCKENSILCEFVLGLGCHHDLYKVVHQNKMLEKSS